jgi:secondary thiamine-phosphate synthase enzyme
VLGRLTIETGARSLTDVTLRLERWLEANGCADGLLTLFLRHTSASLTIQENADPDVQSDLASALDRLAPEGGHWRHSTEGPDDMPAHVKAMLTGVDLSIPVEAGRMLLGTWQGVYVFEHRARPHSRELALHFIGTFRDQASRI